MKCVDDDGFIPSTFVVVFVSVYFNCVFFLLGYTLPDLNTCRVAVIDSQGENTVSTNTGGQTNCGSQRDEWINTQPAHLHFAIKADFTKDMGYYVPYVSESHVGIVAAKIRAVKISLGGQSGWFCTVSVIYVVYGSVVEVTGFICRGIGW